MRILHDYRCFCDHGRYGRAPILQQAVAEIPWGHNILILNKLESKKERQFYIESSAKFGWSRNILATQISADLYRAGQVEKKHNFNEVLPNHLATQAAETMRGIYHLGFLGLKEPVKEFEVESKMVEKIKTVMLSIGYGFTFMGNQFQIKGPSKDYYIDLLFYNRPLQALVAIELKVGEFKPEYAGKMNFYLELLDEFVKLPHENPSIGIILCSHHDKFDVEYSLRSLSKPVGVANYVLTKKLPLGYADKLPEPKLLAEEFMRQLNFNFGEPN